MLANGQLVFGKSGKNSLQVSAGVNDDGFARVLVAENGAVAAQHADGKCFTNHFGNSWGKENSPAESRAVVMRMS